MDHYTKVFKSMLDSTVWQEDADTRLVWVTMLVMADSNGCVWASVPGLADRAKVSRAACERALERFMSPDPDSRSREQEGRRIEEIDRGWRIINHEKFMSMGSSSEARRQQNRDAQARFRERNRKLR